VVDFPLYTRKIDHNAEFAARPALQPPHPAAVRRRYTAHRVYTRLFVADDVYDLFKRGTALLEAGEFHQATVPLSKAAAREPEKTSIREALGRAYFRSRQFEAARVEFEAVVDRAPTNDYALFCLGRALLELGRPAEARKPLALAAQLRPERRDYRIYRERAAKAA
jgi:Flp pilus assembly protein TadD